MAKKYWRVLRNEEPASYMVQEKGKLILKHKWETQPEATRAMNLMRTRDEERARQWSYTPGTYRIEYGYDIKPYHNPNEK